MTDEDRAMLQYFWGAKRDVTRWVHWEERKEIIRQSDPILVKAIEALETAEALVDRLIGDL